jgi:Ni/Fe-hydrogenase subunit HybB-like protein
MTMTSTERRFRLPGFWTGLLFLLLAAGAVITVIRYTQGLGAVTNLSDRFPWGLWVGFDILCGVGLAAGGFTLTTVVYVFNMKRYKPIVRPTVLTAFLGYSLVVAGLMFDLGRPWNIWHPLVMWNHHSVMFEVSWCVTLYLTVLFLEVSGAIFERLGWKRAVAIQHGATPLLVIAGAILSTLHQSSLGAFYLIVPGKLHPLWYTPALPVMFFLSAVAVGPAMVIVESRLSSRAFGRGLEMPLLMSVGRALAIALGLFGAFRLFDLARRGQLGAAFGPGREAAFFQLEFGLGVILPLALLLWPAVRRNSGRLYAAALMVVVGFVVGRLNVSITGLEGALGGHYVPAIPEVIVTLMLTSIGFAVFALAVKYLPIFPPLEEPLLHEAIEAPASIGLVTEAARS